MKVFISHSSKDKEYGEAIVQILRDIGIPQGDIVFTSKPGYGIPKGNNIFQWLKSRLQERPFVIYLLSNNYYSSIPCLNEMGAAWVIENDHIVLFVPGFEPNNNKFWEGAIDPRELGVFIDNKNDIIEFTDLIINKTSLTTSHIVLAQAVSKYMEAIDDIVIHQECDQKSETTNMNKVHDLHAENNSCNNCVIIGPKEIPDLYQINTITNTTFEEDILKGKLTDEELLLIKYMSDTGKCTLGDRWMADEEITNIRRWEDINELDSELSDNYNGVLSKFKIRKYVVVNSTTSYGNPREYILIEDISNRILNLPESILKILNEAVHKHLKSKRASINRFPF